jgi:hypothetical protein
MGTKEYLESIDKIFLHNKLVKNKRKVKKPSKIHAIVYGGNNVIRNISYWLYKDSTIFLDRKLNILQKFNILNEQLNIISRKPINHIGDKNPRAKKYEIIDPNKKRYIISGGLRLFCKKNNLRYSNILDVAFGRIKEYKGWKCKCIGKCIPSNPSDRKIHDNERVYNRSY